MIRLRFDCDATAVRLPVDCNSTALSTIYDTTASLPVWGEVALRPK